MEAYHSFHVFGFLNCFVDAMILYLLVQPCVIEYLHHFAFRYFTTHLDIHITLYIDAIMAKKKQLSFSQPIK